MTSPIQLSTFSFAVWEVVVQHGRPQGSLCRAVPLLQTNAWPDAKTQPANILRGYTCQAPVREGCQTQQSRNCEGEKRLLATPSYGRVGERELLYQRRCSAAYEVSRQLSAGSQGKACFRKWKVLSVHDEDQTARRRGTKPAVFDHG